MVKVYTHQFPVPPPSLPSFPLPALYLMRHGQHTIHISCLIELLAQAFGRGDKGKDRRGPERIGPVKGRIVGEEAWKEGGREAGGEEGR